MRNVVDVKLPVSERKTEYYAIPNAPYAEVRGPAKSIPEVEAMVADYGGDDGDTWVICTKVKLVRFSPPSTR